MKNEPTWLEFYLKFSWSYQMTSSEGVLKLDDFYYFIY